jgi:hypothetical protein
MAVEFGTLDGQTFNTFSIGVIAIAIGLFASAFSVVFVLVLSRNSKN